MAQVSDAQLQSRYKHNEIDIAPLDDPAAFEKDPSLSRALTRLNQFSVLFLTLIQSRNPTLEDVRVREAIALAIGRRAVAKVGERPEPSTSLVPSTLPGFGAGVGFRENIARARQLMAEAGYPGGKGFPTFSIMTSHDDPYVRAVVKTLKQNLGIKAVQDVEDPGVESAKSARGATGELHRLLLDRLHGHPDMEGLGFQPLPAVPDGAAQPQAGRLHALRGPASEGDREVPVGGRELPRCTREPAVPAVRRRGGQRGRNGESRRATALYKQAAAIRQATYEFIPYAYGALVYAIRPSIKGVHLWTGYFTISFKGVSVR